MVQRKITSEHLVLPTDILVEPFVQDNSLDVNVAKLTVPSEILYIESNVLSFIQISK